MVDISQSNLYLLLPGIVCGVARIYAQEHNCGPIEGVLRVYASKLYPILADESTKLWQWGAVALYEEMLQLEGEESTVVVC